MFHSFISYNIKCKCCRYGFINLFDVWINSKKFGCVVFFLKLLLGWNIWHYICTIFFLKSNMLLLLFGKNSSNRLTYCCCFYQQQQQYVAKTAAIVHLINAAISMYSTTERCTNPYIRGHIQSLIQGFKFERGFNTGIL